LNLNPESSQACTGLAEILLIEGLQNPKLCLNGGVKNNPNNIIAVEGLKKVNFLLGISDNKTVADSTLEIKTDVIKLLNKAYSLLKKRNLMKY